MGFGDGTNFYGGGVGNFTLNTWIHLVGKVKGINYVKAYVNASVILNNTSITTNISHMPTFFIGRAFNAAGRYFDGLIDEVRVSDIIRSDDYITTSYRNQSVIPGDITFTGQEVNGNIARTLLYIQPNTGNVGIGTASPTSKLQVSGLPEYADNTTAIAGGLSVGAFYRTGDVLKVVH